MENSLFGEEFNIKIPESNVKGLLNKLNNKSKDTTTDPEKLLKSKKLSLAERLIIIKTNVLKILGKQRNNVVVIKDRDAFEAYIDEAIATGRIAIDTETNNSLDPVTCQLIGPCFYYPGGKQAYVPINHRDPETKVRLSWQLTEQDCTDMFKKIVDSGIDIIMHNGKFDYEVIKCTCNIEVRPTWDTMVAARLLNENELAGLKKQYVSKIDPTQEKYDIEKLFENVAYADVDPEIFALYAATDSMMTDKLYEIQKVELDKPEYGSHTDLLGTHEVKGLRWLFHNVEMPIVIVTAEMELAGVAVDEEYGQRLKDKYNAQLAKTDEDINAILASLAPLIAAWKTTKQATERLKTYASKKSKMSKEKLEATYPNEDKFGRYKLGKAPIEILEDPINLASPAQLAVLFYDILKVNQTVADEDLTAEILKKAEANFDPSRKTGKDELKTIKEKLNEYLPKFEELETEFDEEDLEEDIETAIELSKDEKVAFRLGCAAKLADLILKRRGIAKLVTTYVDVIPDLVTHWPDHRIRFHLNSLGTDTGRYSSGGKLKFMENEEPIVVSGINIQNIPSHNPEIRMLFKAATKQHEVVASDNYYAVPETDEVETIAGWKKVQDLAVGDIIIGENTKDAIKNIAKQDRNYLLYI